MATNEEHQALLDRLTQTVRDLGADPNLLRGKILRELMHTTTKLAADGADVGELKLLSRSLKELRYALKVFRPYKDIRKISIFGSARTPVDHPDYIAAADFARDMAMHEWMVITGAGDGIMRAGHDGAERQQSFGVSINLPFETNANDIIAGDNKLITFRYFFTRKLIFMWMSHAVALFPGGFGTQDEGFEALTLIQTGKAPILPIVCVDPPGGDYWKHWDNYVRKSLLDKGWISEDDLNLYKLFDDPTAAADHIRQFYRNYHSARFVRDT
ncbi:MAG: LOG family protein, partial [Planctomycetota bacterium]